MTARKVVAGFFSFTEITDPAEHRAYNEWHQLDHMPEQLPLDGIAYGQRWVSTPAVTRAVGSVIVVIAILWSVRSHTRGGSHVAGTADKTGLGLGSTSSYQVTPPDRWVPDCSRPPDPVDSSSTGHEAGRVHLQVGDEPAALERPEPHPAMRPPVTSANSHRG